MQSVAPRTRHGSIGNVSTSSSSSSAAMVQPPVGGNHLYEAVHDENANQLKLEAELVLKNQTSINNTSCATSAGTATDLAATCDDANDSSSTDESEGHYLDCSPHSAPLRQSPVLHAQYSQPPPQSPQRDVSPSLAPSSQNYSHEGSSSRLLFQRTEATAVPSETPRSYHQQTHFNQLFCPPLLATRQLSLQYQPHQSFQQYLSGTNLAAMFGSPPTALVTAAPPSLAAPELNASAMIAGGFKNMPFHQNNNSDAGNDVADKNSKKARVDSAAPAEKTPFTQNSSAAGINFCSQGSQSDTEREAKH